MSTLVVPALSQRATRSVAAALAWPRRWLAGGVILLGIASAAAVAAVPILLRKGIDSGVATEDTAVLAAVAAALVAVTIVGGLAAGLQAALMVSIAQRALHELRMDAFAGVMRIDVGTFDRSRRGDLQARLTGDVAALDAAATELLPQLVSLAILAAGGVAAIAFLSPRSAAVALLVLVPIGLAARWLGRRGRLVYPEHRRLLASLTGEFVESVEGASTFRAYGAEHHRRARLTEANDRVIRNVRAGSRMRNRYYSGLSLAQAAVLALLVVTVSLRVESGAISVGTAAAVLLAAGGVMAPLVQLAGRLDDVHAAGAAFTRVAALTAVPVRRPGAAEPGPGMELKLENVSFAYLPGRTVIHDVSLAVEAGESLAFVGRSGSGKSTVTRLASGLAAPQNGRVTLGGTDLAQITDATRSRLVATPQGTHLVAGSIAHNVRLTAPWMTDQELDELVERIGLVGLLSGVPGGLDFNVRPGGANLSAGQQQLVALLRVVACDPLLVVLDEATSLLDRERDRQVGEALTTALDGRIVLVVAHRRETAERCDRVAVIADGRIVALGTPTELEATSPSYRALWTSLTEPAS